ncbi:ShlB/FhaC/HecB family hemolysin secretion/activation protein [Pandoraea nosoerga]|uniref:Peptide transporter n=1 Tax=Pandoraea nosoerga TaxID=2508296 RepID=A0A5E4ULF5_9BURK|nr:POTRA domain-containing protein [Pandoraea nosoerga]MBN4664734.1 ShlB/FhaC/HecB family hemolysin secretion/activation protein [Pandoraea nosoerga]MBN4674092.1 ShlB/FhaC/HecB family hemolysin secretion/activation protein [Pandoraea nosoerga]MBN4679974.1 ShlB/FhaC/HecB family hemolysin secretion/activation protein [Pandoraea nosoerga]MBN4744311.1 ShlB/FhaC/HecB family hemolysin secretion/activation protein [Pandoraea nosoerga]VVE00861.1 peptide transporter [Pandoraea nosoerga]
MAHRQGESRLASRVARADTIESHRAFHRGLRRHRRAVRFVAAATAVIGLLGAQQARADASPVRGDPMQSLPKIEAPKAPAATIRIQPPTQEDALKALLARKITPQRFGIEGVKSLPFDQIAALFAPMAGKEVTIGDLVETANQVTKMYQDAGYLLSFAFVPAQDFAGGFVRVTVVEGYISGTKISGTPGPSEQRLRDIAAHIEAERPLKRATFERYLNLLTLVPGMKIKADVQPPTQTDGATELSLDVSRQPVALGTSLSYNNPGIRGVFTVTSNALTPLGEQIQLTAIAPKGHNDEEFYAASYIQPLGSNGLQARVDASHYRGQPDDQGLPGLTRHLDTKRLAVGVSYPLLLNNQRSLTISGGMYGVNSRDRYEVPDSPNFINSQTNVRAAQAQLAYNEVTEKQTRSATLGVFKGFNGMGASQSYTTQPAGVVQILGPYDLAFWRFTLDAKQGVVLPWDFGIVVSAGAQYSSNTLPTSEQATFGGQRYGLGYPAGEIAGDKGWGASIEVNRMFRMDFRYLKTVQPYLLFDTAKVYMNYGQLFHNQLASLGLGVRISDSKYYSLDLSLAKPMADAPTNAPRRPLRFNANWSYQFE